MSERDYSHITISEGDPTELADMKLAYLTAARERDALLDALKEAEVWLEDGGRPTALSIIQTAIKAAS